MIYGACIAVCCERRQAGFFAFSPEAGLLRQRSEGLRDAVMAKLSLSAPELVHRKVIYFQCFFLLTPTRSNLNFCPPHSIIRSESRIPMGVF